ncbi:hypothetical protein BP422_13080 [Brevibacillus formosus]|uniref:Uncharacterized protein n=1 Tax=Brevibacillus formosus TaxID=54913 RepID=A0A220MHA5_9BACL|nr:hypothetical protein [Brevibacillus formosus]ASJ54407.1 hypothetical protein BP422_13080 [Brevibacillus formosus]
MEKKVVSIQDLIAKAKGREEKELKKAEVYIKSIDGLVIIQEPDKAKVDEYLTMIAYGNKNKPEDMKTENEKLVYEFIVEPDLRDEALRKALKVSAKHPYQVVNKIFDTFEVALLADELVKLAGVESTKSVELVDEVKN